MFNKFLAGVLVACLAALGFAISGCYSEYYRAKQIECLEQCAGKPGFQLDCTLKKCSCECLTRPVTSPRETRPRFDF